MIEVTLHADGTSSAVLRLVYPGGGGFSYYPESGTYVADCGDGPGQEVVVELTGTHALPGPSTGDRGTVSLDSADGVRILQGSYTAEEMQLEYRLDVYYEAFAERVTDPRTYWDYDFPSLTPAN